MYDSLAADLERAAADPFTPAGLCAALERLELALRTDARALGPCGLPDGVVRPCPSLGPRGAELGRQIGALRLRAAVLYQEAAWGWAGPAELRREAAEIAAGLRTVGDHEAGLWLEAAGHG